MQASNSAAQEVEEAPERRLLDRLKRMGITAWHEPLLCLPKEFRDYSKVRTLKQAITEDTLVSVRHLFALVVTEKPVILSQPKKRLILSATDGMLTVKIVVFVVPGVDIAPLKALTVGERFHVEGTLQNWNGTLQMVGPTLIPPTVIGNVIPIYEKRRGVVADGAIFEATRHALAQHLPDTIAHLIASFPSLSETEMLRRAKLKASSIEVILRATHAPTSEDEGQRGLAALRRLAALSIVENARHLKRRDPAPESVLAIPAELLDELAARLPYPLTADQQTAIREIAADMAAPVPMRRVLSGDVGCGKSFCIMIPALATQRLGYRAVILTPNALLAEQFVSECKEHFGQDTNIVTVTAATKKLDFSGNPILVGTTALLTRLKGHAAPTFLAVDEEQKLSVGQKLQLGEVRTNYLQATATPIPRTTALITHGAMAVSIIRTMPVAKTIQTHLVAAGEARRLFEHTRKVLDAGGQVALVYPIVKNEEQQKKSVVAAYAEWDKHFPGMVAMVHGQMKEADKLAAVQALKDGRQKIAIVSTVIEIGVTLPSLRSLIVVHAERHGTSTLHQLRGRVARKGGMGYFFMYLPQAVAAETRKRLDLLVEHADGFALAEKDAELRGYGDLFEDAERQSGNSRSTVFRCIDLTPAELHAAAQAADATTHF